MTHVVRAWRTSRTIRLFVLIALLGTATQLVLSRERGAVQDGTRQTKVIGSERLVSIEPLPGMDGKMCPLPATAAESLVAAASAPESLMAALQQQSRPAGAAAGDRRPVETDRAPLRTIRDPNPMFSAIAVEPESNMLVVTDENLFQVLEYDRRDNTPSTARITEPKRVIGGTLTQTEMMCEH